MTETRSVNLAHYSYGLATYHACHSLVKSGGPVCSGMQFLLFSRRHMDVSRAATSSGVEPTHLPCQTPLPVTGESQGTKSDCEWVRAGSKPVVLSPVGEYRVFASGFATFPD